MTDQNLRPRWGWLFLILPLAAVLLWLVTRVHTSIAGRKLLELGTLVLVGVYVETWRRISLGFLLRHPLTGGRVAVYRAREAVPARPPTTIAVGQRPAATFYSDLFAGPVSVTAWQPAPDQAEARPDKSEPSWQ